MLLQRRQFTSKGIPHQDIQRNEALDTLIALNLRVYESCCDDSYTGLVKSMNNTPFHSMNESTLSFSRLHAISEWILPISNSSFRQVVLSSTSDFLCMQKRCLYLCQRCSVCEPSNRIDDVLGEELLHDYSSQHIVYKTGDNNPNSQHHNMTNGTLYNSARPTHSFTSNNKIPTSSDEKACTSVLYLYKRVPTSLMGRAMMYPERQKLFCILDMVEEREQWNQ